MLLKKNKEKIDAEFQKISYSQSGEDLIVKFIFDAININLPTYIDIGAHHPFYINNTALFYSLGCTGINVEPNPQFHQLLKDHRPKDINLNIGITEHTSIADFYIINAPTLSTFSLDDADKYKSEGNYFIEKTIKINTDKISNILNKYAGGKFPHFLNIDAEGIDDIIVKSIDFKNNFPIVICIETISFSNNGHGIKNNTLINTIVDNGYIVYADTYINTIFVKKEFWVR